MPTFFPSDDLAESRRKHDQDRIACFLHLRDLVYRHPEAASAGAVAFVQKLEATMIASKAARDTRLAAVREREARRSTGLMALLASAQRRPVDDESCE